VGEQAHGWNGSPRRRVERYELKMPLDVTVLRSGIPDTVPGRTLNFCERGIAAMLAGELTPGETVAVEVQLPLSADPLRTRALVKYQDKLRCGLEFVGLSAEQREAIRDCTKTAKAEVSVSSKPVSLKTDRGKNRVQPEQTVAEPVNNDNPDGSGRRHLRPGWVISLVALGLVAIGAGVFWWRWNRAWEELESGLKNGQTVSAEKPQAQVPAEVMEKLLIHRVEPVYPAEARRANVQGIIALDIVVGRDGSVTSMHALNGPDVLARAAMDALRWWKFEPYRLNGEPAVVETTVAVEFRK
jgi:TonB family protein